MVVMALNNYIATQLKGLSLCQMIVNYTIVNGCSIQYPEDYCTAGGSNLSAQVSLQLTSPSPTHGPTSPAQMTRFERQRGSELTLTLWDAAQPPASSSMRPELLL